MEQEETYAVLKDPEMKEILESFFIETREILEKLDIDLVELEKQPDNIELLNQIFRSFHTIKGTSGFFNLVKLQAVTHRCEDILNKLRKGEAKLNSSIMDAILLAYDSIKTLLNCIEENSNESVDVQDTLKSLQKVLDKLEKGSSQQEESNEDVSTKSVQVQSTEEKDSKKTDNTIRVDVDRLEELLNIASELVLGRNRLSQVYSEIALEYEGYKFTRDLAEAAKQIDRMTNELQSAVMKTRMIKIGKVFNRFPRVVRDLSKEAKKKIQLKISGEETELDKTVIEEIYDPLVHLVRNAVDHAIELPAQRKKTGKNEVGTISLSAVHEGNHIIICVEDDGKGIDPDIIKDKAISKGLITPERAKELSKNEICNLIFLPGFSTAEKVTNISGRGVGMDVVKTNVTKLRGMIDIETEKGYGTKIIIKLPLTLAIIPGMIVKVASQSLVIPLNSIIEVLRVHTENIQTINGNEVIKLRDNVIPLIDVKKVLFDGLYAEESVLWQYVVIVGVAEKRFGIKVDGLVGQKEIVIKPLGNYLGTVNSIAGSTILGDGTVIMILDISELVNSLEKKNN